MVALILIVVYVIYGAITMPMVRVFTMMSSSLFMVLAMMVLMRRHATHSQGGFL